MTDGTEVVQEITNLVGWTIMGAWRELPKGAQAEQLRLALRQNDTGLEKVARIWLCKSQDDTPATIAVLTVGDIPWESVAAAIATLEVQRGPA